MSIDLNKLKIILPCHFGLEAVAKREVIDMGFNIDSVVDGEVRIIGSINCIPKLNINLRTVERVLIEVGEFKATTFEELYDNIYKLEIEKFISVNDKFIIKKANQDKNSKLHSSISIQSIVKKAMVDKLKNVYNTGVLLENEKDFNFRIKFNKDICSVRLDTTGDSLHKRGYRIKSGLAPIEETLAAAIIMLSPYRKDRLLVDTFCGSGTFLIEAAMIAANIAPSIDRAFTSETWNKLIDRKVWKEEFDIAKSKIDYDFLARDNKTIFGYDIDKNMIEISKENAKRAGVLDAIHFETKAVKDFYNSNQNGFIITNPPYGERLEDRDSIIPIYIDLKNAFQKLNNWSMFVITSYEEAEKILGKATKNRKIYNGMIKTYLYSYMGEYKKANKKQGD